ncbi:hypothetical protein [Paenibacillus sp. UASWS1643]|uniref:hypothetical protein n=1 Tax=Paenibacillus sp. UASWS1643 TaxID=2580422 RepID=UPI0012396373|nr:hypothetical protein [Paenibacillus sp. UASWS1643]KAA8747105.1 hypothetical protein FE296_23245 [Paenibacillus sp. UASWS1643]
MTTVPSMVSQQLGLLSSGADPADVRTGQSFIKPGTLAIQSGTMTDNGDLGTIVPKATDVPIPEGYTTGGVVQGDADLVPSNIKAGTDIFGVTGTAVLASGNAVNANVLAGVTYSSSSGFGTGTMPNNGSLGIIIPDTTTKTIPAGYTTGGSVAGSINLIPSNIRSGTSIYGVTGSVIQASGSATADKLLLGETASTAAGTITGTMPNNGSLGTITPGATNKPIPAGYTTGGSVAGSGNLQAGNIRLGVNIFGVTGALDPGTQTGGTANPEDVLAGETFTNDSGVQTGIMVNNGAVNLTPSNTSQPIPQGYHNGGGQVNPVTFDTTKVLAGTTIAGTAGTMPNNGDLGTITPGIDTQAIPSGYTSGGTVAGDIDLVPENIKNGVNIFGVTGTLENMTINGQTELNIVYGENISAYDPVRLSLGVVTGNQPTNLPAGAGNGIAFSADGTYFAVVSSGTPYVIIYKLTGGNYSKISDPASLPSSSGRGVTWSSDGVYLAVSLISAPYVAIYKRSGDVFTKLSDPDVLPTGNGNGIAFSPDGLHLAIAHSSSPFLSIYKRTGDVFNKLANPATTPANQGNGVSYSSDGVHLAVANSSSPEITIYKRSGDTYTKLSNPSMLPTGTGQAVAFSPDGQQLAISHISSPFMTVYSRNGDVFTKIPNPQILPPGTGAYGISYNATSEYIFVGTNATSFLALYRRNGESLTKMNDPDVIPTGRGTGTSFSPNNVDLAISYNTAPYITLYKMSQQAYKSNGNMSDIEGAIGAGYALESGSTNETKKIALIWRDTP